MLEHIFRNINDIRVFDAMVEFTEECPQDTHEILELLDYPERENIQIRDSIYHLIKERILAVKLVPIESTTGCDQCKDTDEKGLPRIKGHESHKPEVTEIVQLEHYYFVKNQLTELLVGAIFQSSMYNAEEIMEEQIKDRVVVNMTEDSIGNDKKKDL